MDSKNNIKKLVNESIERISYLSERAKMVKESTIKQMDQELEDLRVQQELIENALAEYEKAEEDKKAEALEKLEAELDWSVIDKVKYRFYQWSDKLADFPEWADKTFSAIVAEATNKAEDIEKEIADLEKKAAESSGELKDKIEKEIENLKQRKQEVEQRAHDFSEQSSHAWNAFSDGIREAGSSLNKAFKEAYNSFNKK